MIWHLNIVSYRVALRKGMAFIVAATLWWLPTVADAVPAYPKLRADHYDPLDLVSLARSSDLDFGTPNAIADSYDDLTRGRELSLGNSRRVVGLLIRSFDAKSKRGVLQNIVEPKAEDVPFILERFTSKEPAGEQEPAEIERGVTQKGFESNRSNDGADHQSTLNALRFMVNIVPDAAVSRLDDALAEDSPQQPASPNMMGGSGLDPIAGTAMLSLFAPQMSASGLVSFSVLGLGDFSIVVSERNWSLTVAGMTFNLDPLRSSYDRSHEMYQKLPRRFDDKTKTTHESVFGSTNEGVDSLVSKLFNQVSDVLGDPVFVVIIMMFSVVFIVLKIMRKMAAD